MRLVYKARKTYILKLRPNHRTRWLDSQIGVAASVWNYCVALEKNYYKFFHKYANAYALQKHVTKLKRRGGRYARWNELNSQAVQDVAERIDKAYQAFFKNVKERKAKITKRVVRPPKFRKSKKYRSFTLKQCGYKLFKEEHYITIAKRKYAYYGTLPSSEIKTCTIKRTPLGEYFVALSCIENVEVVHRSAGNAVGMDFGLKTFLTLSDGRKIESPLFLKQALRQLRKANHNLSKCVEGSKNYLRAKKTLARIHERVASLRKDWQRKLAKALALQYTVISIEDLNLDGMKRLWGRKVSDLAFAQFVLYLDEECKKAGSILVKIGRWDASSQTCHNCGCKSPITKNLRVREWTCLACGETHDRDVNAALNIRDRGLAILAEQGLLNNTHIAA